MASITQNSFVTRVETLMGLSHTKSKKTPGAAVMFIAAVFLVFIPFEIEHLVTMAVGAGAYCFLHVLRPPSPSKRKAAKMIDVPCDDAPPLASTPKRQSSPEPVPKISSCRLASSAPLVDVRSESAMPVKAPVFQSTSWDDAVNELLGQITPTSACEDAVAQIRSIVKRSLRSVFPDADVESYVSGNLKGGKAFGVAVPDVEFVIHVCPKMLAKHMSLHGNASYADSRQLLKCALRACTENLAGSGLKFRRSAFSGEEPKVTFLAPTSLDICDVSVPFDFAINSVTPSRNSTLLAECARIDSRTLKLILLVRRWAKDRAICFAPKGHLSPYMWTILAIYYMQVGGDFGPLLPPFQSLDGSVDLGKSNVAKKNKATRSIISISELLEGFFRFYAVGFEWSAEAIDIRTGKRAAPSIKHSRLRSFADAPKQKAKPVIEDPFTAGHLLGDNMTDESFDRLKEEFTRASKMCSGSKSLTTLLEPWAPSEVDPAEAASTKAGQSTLDWRSPVKSCPGLLSAPVTQTARLGPAAPASAGQLLSAPVTKTIRLGPPSSTVPEGGISAPMLSSVRLGPPATFGKRRSS